MAQCALEGCKKKFSPKSSNHKYCSPTHAKRASDRRWKTSAPMYKRTCALRGCSVMFETKQPQKVYCSISHRRAAHRARLAKLAALGRKNSLHS